MAPSQSAFRPFEDAVKPTLDFEPSCGPQKGDLNLKLSVHSFCEQPFCLLSAHTLASTAKGYPNYLSTESRRPDFEKGEIQEDNPREKFHTQKKIGLLHPSFGSIDVPRLTLALGLRYSIPTRFRSASAQPKHIHHGISPRWFSNQPLSRTQRPTCKDLPGGSTMN